MNKYIPKCFLSIQKFKEHWPTNKFGYYKNEHECRQDLDTLQEIVDKETPMKVSIIDEPDLFYIYYCPDCGATLLVDRSGHPKHLFNYCGKCRRKLDWSEEND